MKIIVDENIEFGQEAFEQFGEVILSHGRKITNEMLKDAFALIVRSITSVNEELLKGTNVKFVGTATIGTDHLDIEYLDLAKIMHSSAPGCNSFAVTEYVLTALSKISYEQNFNLEDKSLGVIGYGNIGKKITSFAKAIGMNVAVNDPPLEREGFDYDFSTLEEALECDIITLHVPLNKTGIDKTYHLLDEERINNLKPGTILINTSRGAVVDNIALLNRLKNKNDITVVLDVWENEPSINQELLQNVFLGTQHIAGYSYEGKENLLYSITNKIYPIQQDSQTLKSYAELNTAELAKQFDLLRKNYKLRREFNNYFIQTDNLTVQQKSILEKLRFNFV
jgi:erythronate-4-phosphate dehydrogenase